MLEPERRGQKTTMLWEPPCCLTVNLIQSARSHRTDPDRGLRAGQVVLNPNPVTGLRRIQAQQDQSDKKPEWNQCVSVT